jgi:hypothetical protein
MKQLFFELIQVATDRRECLERGPEPEEWQALHELAQRQAVAGICYRGVERLFEFGLRAPQDVSIDWMAEAEEMKEQNEQAKTPSYVARYYDEELCNLRQSSEDYYVLNRPMTIEDVYRLFLEQRLNMRVVIDYYFLLLKTERRYETLKTSGFPYVLLRYFGVRRFARGMMWVLQEVMGMECSQMLCKPSGREGRFILQEMLDGHQKLEMLKRYQRL